MLEILDLKKSFPQPDGERLAILDIPEFRVDAGEQVVLCLLYTSPSPRD